MQLTVVVATMLTVFRLKSAPEVLTLKSCTKVPALVTIRPQVAVPVALAEASAVIALKVKTPLDAFDALG